MALEGKRIWIRRASEYGSGGQANMDQEVKQIWIWRSNEYGSGGQANMDQEVKRIWIWMSNENESGGHTNIDGFEGQKDTDLELRAKKYGLEVKRL